MKAVVGAWRFSLTDDAVVEDATSEATTISTSLRAVKVAAAVSLVSVAAAIAVVASTNASVAVFAMAVRSLSEAVVPVGGAVDSENVV